MKASPNARTVELAFVFDGPSDKKSRSFKSVSTDNYKIIIAGL